MDAFKNNILKDLGGFGALFSITKAKEMQDPVLVSSTGGVGAKLKVAFTMDQHHTVGIDCVAMCVNEIVCSGAEPLFFLDYIACGKSMPEKMAEIRKGISVGCDQAGVSLIGGETVEIPHYPANEYDLAGFAVGLLDKANQIDGSSIAEGDVIIGLAASGIHSAGFSVVRKVLRPSELNITEYIQMLGSELGSELIKPTKIYAKSILHLIKNIKVKGISNIAAGGLMESIPKIIPDGLCADIQMGTWEVLPIFSFLKQSSVMDDLELYNTFNMGIGMVVVVDKANADAAIAILTDISEKVYKIGEITKQDVKIRLC